MSAIFSLKPHATKIRAEHRWNGYVVFCRGSFRRNYDWHDEFSVTINGENCEVEACLPGRHDDSDYDFYLYGDDMELCREVRASELIQHHLEMIDAAFDEWEKARSALAGEWAEDLKCQEYKEARAELGRHVSAAVRGDPSFATAPDIFADAQ